MIPGVTGVFFEDQTWECLANAVVHFKDTEYDYAAIKRHAEKFSVGRFKREIGEFVRRECENL